MTTKKSTLMSKVMVFILALAVVFTYSVMPMNQAYAASSKKPAKVTNLKATALSSSSVKLTWKKAKNAKKYEVYYSTKSKSGFKKVKTTKYTTFTKKSLKAGKKYYFKVRAVNGKKKGSFSKVVPRTTKKKAKEKDPTLGESKARTMTIEIDMSDETRYPAGNEIEVWVPVPRDGEDYQTVSNYEVSVENTEAVEEAGIFDEDNSGWNNKMAYIKWKKDAAPADRKATVSFDAERFAVSRPDAKEDTSVSVSAEAQKFLGKTGRVDPGKEIVKKYAKIAAGDAKTNLGKAENIYNWIIANLERLDIGDDLGNGVTFTNDTGCGKGDPADLLENFEKYGRWGGHCTDLNSCFVGLCRAAGVPAREMFGIRMNDTASDGQHCWAEFYVPGEGWTYADPGDVLKEARAQTSDRSKEAIEAARKTEAVAAKKKALWLGVDNNRVVLSRGRDVVLNPAQKAGVRNTFGYPYAEMNGEQKDAAGNYIDCTKYKDFKYTITCSQIGAVDYVNLSDEDWAKYGIEAGELVNADYLIDVRPSAQKEANGYVPGAVEVPVGNPYTAEEKAAIKKAFDEMPDGGRAVIVCVTGNKLARNAMAALQAEGVDMSKVTYLKGGFNNSWSKNYPVIAPDKKSVSVPAWVTQGAGENGELMMVKDGDKPAEKCADMTHHVLVNEKGSNAPVALLNTKALPLHVYNALVAIGGEPYNKFNAKDQTEEFSLAGKGSAINVTIDLGDGAKTLDYYFDHVTKTNKEILADASITKDNIPTEPYNVDMRFGGCMKNIQDKFDSPSGNQTGCITCTFSCWIGTVSNGAYEYSSQETKVIREHAPVGTPATVVYTIAN